MLNSFLLILMISVFFGCNQKTHQKIKKDPNLTKIQQKKDIQKQYVEYKKGLIQIMPDEETELKKSEIGYIELKENLSTGYKWNYTISDTSVIIPDSDKSFNMAPQNRTGSSSQHIWKFKKINDGKTTLIFKYYRSWEGEKSAIDSFTYKIK